MDTSHLPTCPNHFKCPITQFRMVHPVIAKDGQTYERDAIQHWFDEGNVTSPLHSTILVSTELIVNQAMKTLIQEWVEENTSLKGLQGQLHDLHGPLVTATTSKEVHETIKNIHQLVRRKKKFFFFFFPFLFFSSSFFCPLLNDVCRYCHINVSPPF